MHEVSVIVTGIYAILLALLIVILFAVYVGIRDRFAKGDSKKSNRKPKFHAHGHIEEPEQPIERESEHVHAEPAFQQTFRKLDKVFGLLTRDGEEYQTFNSGEVTISTASGVPVLAFTIVGDVHRQREINRIRISDDLRKYDGTVYYVRHNRQDLQNFTQWLDSQLYGGTYHDEALFFKDLMKDMDTFNQMLATRTIRYRGGQYLFA